MRTRVAGHEPTTAAQVERAYRRIKAGILDGTYPPRAPLSELLLVQQHGVARAAVREGLVRLWQERYLDRVVGRGYSVVRVTAQSINDTFEVRRLLEGAAASRAAELCTRPDAERLRQLATLNPPAGYRRNESANARFHLAIARIGRNRLASDLIERCLRQIDLFMSLGVDFGTFQQGATDAHLAIVDAIAQRDPAAAKARMEEHLDRGSRLMQEALLRGALSLDSLLGTKGQGTKGTGE